MDLNEQYIAYKEKTLFGRYLPPALVNFLLEKHASYFNVQSEGVSEQQRKIQSITLGKGTFKILMWSQMHGNESTTTKSIFDVLNFLQCSAAMQTQILEHCTIKIVPMLNPDGAQLYTRANYNGVDLNRDAVAQTQNEIKVLFGIFTSFKPHLCLNMHDQRSIFSVGTTPKSAVLSFLAPAADAAKSITPARKKAMQYIAFLNEQMQQTLPGHIGRYDDTFNPNCVGDSFQSLGVPTVLIEAGHYQSDYNREHTRKYVFYAIVKLFSFLSRKPQKLPNFSFYFSIPENKKLFYDIIIKKATSSSCVNSVDIAIQFEEQLQQNQVIFVPTIVKIGNFNDYYSHKTIDAQGQRVFINGQSIFQDSQKINNLQINDTFIAIN